MTYLVRLVSGTFAVTLRRCFGITAGFGGKVALVPRLFLRELIDVMDRVDIHEEYEPKAHYKLELEDGKLTAEELAAKHGGPLEAGYEIEGDEEPSAERPTRLDG